MDSPRPPTTVLFKNVPVKTYLQLEQYNEALLRECKLLAIQLNDRQNDTSAAPRIVNLVIRSRRHWASHVGDLRTAVQEAAAQGRPNVDLTTRVGPDGVHHARDFLSLSEDAEELSSEGLLLTPPPDDDIRTLRRWFVDQTIDQVENGATPQPPPV